MVFKDEVATGKAAVRPARTRKAEGAERARLPKEHRAKIHSTDEIDKAL